MAHEERLQESLSISNVAYSDKGSVHFELEKLEATDTDEKDMYHLTITDGQVVTIIDEPSLNRVQMEARKDGHTLPSKWTAM